MSMQSSTEFRSNEERFAKNSCYGRAALKPIEQYSQYVELSSQSSMAQSLVTEMVSYGLNSMIDQNFFIVDGRAEVRLTSVDFDDEGSAIVKNAIWINDLPFSELFPGFSDEVISMANELRAWNGVNLNTAIDKAESISARKFENKVLQLKERSIQDAITFIQEYISSEEGSSMDTRPQLPAEDFEMGSKRQSEDGLATLFIDPELFEDEPKSLSKPGKVGRNDFPEQIIELLEENNRILASYSGMFQSLQSQIDEINARDESDLRIEMAEMRQMIEELKSDPVRDYNADIEYLLFEKNMYALGGVQRARLNQFIVLMAKDPRKKLLIVGYADRSGNSDYNSWLSEKRANTVRQFFENMGIPSQRIIVSYLGDSTSTITGPADRRVEVSLIN